MITEQELWDEKELNRLKEKYTEKQYRMDLLVTRIGQVDIFRLSQITKTCWSCNCCLKGQKRSSMAFVMLQLPVNDRSQRLYVCCTCAAKQLRAAAEKVEMCQKVYGDAEL